MKKTDLNRLYEIAKLRYENKFSKSAIARQKGISVTQISNLLKQAELEGIVEIKINVSLPEITKIEGQLRDKFRLKDVKLTADRTDDADQLFKALGIESARYFESVLNADEVETVAVGGGKTIYHMVDAISPARKNFRHIRVVPAVIGAPRVPNVDASMLWGILSLKLTGKLPLVPFPVETRSEPLQGSIKDISAQLEKERKSLLNNRSVKSAYEDICAAQYLFIGAGSLSHKEMNSMVELKSRGVGVKQLHEGGVIGSINYTLIDKAGKAIMSPFVAPRLDDLRRIAKSKSQQVVLIGGGTAKFEVIQVAVITGVCNVLVTDVTTAKLLLNT
jgi:deoxyribonucleoside regulator